MITTVVGNYPRIGEGLKAPSVRGAITRLDRGEITPADLAQVQDAVTREAIEEQEAAGLDLITDGAIRWNDPLTYFAGRLTGFEILGLVRYFDTNTYYRQPRAIEPVRWTQPILADDYRFAAASAKKPVKVVITGPYTLARLSQLGFYDSLEGLVMALAEALNDEAEALQQAGATFIQFDEPAIVRNKQDFDLFERAMKALTVGITVKTALYTYFGDINGLEDRFFNLPFAVFGLDFVTTPRSFDVIRALPGDREVGLGIVDARNTRLESVDDIRRSVERISRAVPPERIHISPNMGLEFLPRKNARAKIGRIVEAARTIG